MAAAVNSWFYGVCGEQVVNLVLACKVCRLIAFQPVRDRFPDHRCYDGVRYIAGDVPKRQAHLKFRICQADIHVRM
jgi:hypothetical protein